MNNSRQIRIDKGQLQELPYSSTVEDHFVFKAPPSVEIKSAVKGEKNYCYLYDNKWTWKYGGVTYSIAWSTMEAGRNLVEILKAFIFHRIRKHSPKTVATCDCRWISFLRTSNYKHTFPWQSYQEIAEILAAVGQNSDVFYGFKAFYKFGYGAGIKGFTKEFNDAIQEASIGQRSSSQYKKVLLQEINRLSPTDETILLDYLYAPISIEDYCNYRDNVLLHLAFELAPRPIQVHSLSAEDLEVVDSANKKERYFSLWLPMAKKRNTLDVEKRYRKITAILGEKIALLAEENNRLYGAAPNIPLFVDPKKVENGDYSQGRLGADAISKIICGLMQSKGFKKGDGATLLRHHLAQSLADQGASAETIAEILGHNSTLPARAYIAATPAIAAIKTRALGKNKTYQNIMSMLMTGQIIEKESASKGTWVRGMVGSQYIGGIGSCGLPEDTACPKNPVYACYTCAKFHPFRDGTHQEVKLNLQRQVQYFIDIAEKAMALEHNRTFLQLEKTIEAVDAVIQRIESGQ